MTVNELITGSLQLINVVAANESANAEDAALGLRVFNQMLDQWSLQRLMVYYQVNETFELTAGQGEYTIGPAVYLIDYNNGTYTAGSLSATVNGYTTTVSYDTDKLTTIEALAVAINNGYPNLCTAVYSLVAGAGRITFTPTGDAALTITSGLTGITGTMTSAVSQSTGVSYLFSATRPIDITNAFVRDATSGSNMDIHLEVINNKQYQTIQMKSLGSTYPRFLNYVPTYPSGTLNLYPVPDGNNLSLGLSQTLQLANLQSLGDTISLPPGYKTALESNLAVDLAPRFHYVLDAVTARMAAESKANVKRMNAEKTLAVIDYPSSQKRAFNIYEG